MSIDVEYRIAANGGYGDGAGTEDEAALRYSTIAVCFREQHHDALLKPMPRKLMRSPRSGVQAQRTPSDRFVDRNDILVE
jgi:hypothetical protein